MVRKVGVINKRLPKFILITFILVFLLIATSEYIVNQPQFLGIFNTNSTGITKRLSSILSGSSDVNIEVVKKLLVNGADPQAIKRFSKLPSIKLSQILLEKGLTPDRFLNLIMSCHKVNHEEQLAQKRLVEFAFKNGAEPWIIGSFGKLPSMELSKILIAKGLNPIRFLNLVMSCTDVDLDEQLAQKELVEFALKQRANLRAIEIFGKLPSLELSEILVEKGLSPTRFLKLVMSCENIGSNERLVQKRLVEFALKKGADPWLLESFSKLPSMELSKILVAAGLTPSRFLNLVMSCSDINLNERSAQKELVAFALEQGADPQLIESFGRLPAKDLNGMLIKKGIDFTHFLALIISCRNISANEKITQKELVKFALKQGADPQAIKSFGMLPAMELSKILIAKGLKPTRFLKLVMSCENVGSNEKLTQKRLVEFVLKKGANLQAIRIFGKLPSEKTGEVLVKNGLNPTRFLKLVMFCRNVNPGEQATQKKLVEFALKQGADLRVVKIFGRLPSIELSELLIANGLNSTIFLVLIMSYEASYEERIIQKELIELALKEGADPDIIKQIMPIMSQLLFSNYRQELLKLLFNSKYKKSDPKVFYDSVQAANRYAAYYCKVNGICKLYNDPSFILDMKYRNLAAPAAAKPKIPRILHHVWLTNASQRREISSEDIRNVLQTNKIFSHSKEKWQQIVWTNDKSLIPQSVKKLELAGIKVREISEVENHLILRKKIYELIEQKRWGMASNVLRYDLINYLGGVYVDLNYVFKRDVEEEIHKYDYFVQTNFYYLITDFFFGSKAHHPILIKLLKLVARNLSNPPEYITVLEQEKQIMDLTDEATYRPTYMAYYSEANRGTTDVVYPPIIPSNYFGAAAYDNSLPFPFAQEELAKMGINGSNNVDAGLLRRFYGFSSYLYENEIYGTKDYTIGEDNRTGLTWISSEPVKVAKRW